MKKSIFLFLILLFLSQYAYAGGTYIGKVRPHFWGGGLYLTPINAQVLNKPLCATRDVLRLQEFDLNDPAFKSKYAMLLASWMSGKEVKLYGTGDCTAEGDEKIFVIYPL